MTHSDFVLSIIASIVAGLLLSLAAKFTLEKWKKIAIGFGALIVASTMIAVTVFAVFTVTKEFSAYRERSILQEKIDNFTKGHYPKDYDAGYRVEVGRIGERPLLGFSYPESVNGIVDTHPWSNPFFMRQIQKLLNDNGYAGSPAWGYRMKPLTPGQLEELLKRNLD
ncbi:hypothetical protein ACF8LF_16300 [Pseudomonas putida]|uniref:hypothetical protein n=1 Tax=Pseudomonas putida TaxID=303 RepID=UPI00370BEDD1